jgi:hypothetical protein
MKIFELSTYLLIVENMAGEIALGVKLGLAGLILLLAAWRILFGSLMGNFSPSIELFIWGFIALGLLQNYVEVFSWTVVQVETLYDTLRAKTFLLEYFVREPDAYTPAGIQEWLTELVTKTVTGPIAVLSYGFAWLCSGIVAVFSGIFLALLFALGPIYIVMIPATSGRSLMSLLRNVLEICSWKLFCAFTLMIISGVRHVMPSTFLSVLMLDCLVALSALLSPIVVHMIFSSGVSSVGTTMAALGARMAIPPMAHGAATSIKSMAASASALGQKSPVPRPGDPEYVNNGYGYLRGMR